MKTTLHPWGLALALALGLVGCNFGLDEPTLVKTPRILAMVSDHPEAAPGQDVHVRVLAVDPLLHRELHYAFRACIDTSTLTGTGGNNGSGGMAMATPMCMDMTSVEELGTLPGALTQQLVTIIDALPPSSGFDAAFFHRLLDTAGLPMTVRVDVSTPDPAGGPDLLLVSGETLVGITTRATPTTNPPFIYFRAIIQPPEQNRDADPVEVTYIGGTDPAHPFDCVPWLGAPMTALASQPTAVSDAREGHPEQRPNHITFSPADDPSVWEESFPIYDFSGGVRTGHEGAYYSWYSTASLHDHNRVIHSSLHTETTQGSSHGAEPSAIDDTIRDNTLDVPIEGGTYDMWLVVRDGHLGEVACHFTIDVTASP